MSIGLESSAILLIHVRIELRLRVGRNGGRVERDVVWAAADHDELDRVADLIVMSAGSKR